jgi:hypothetical protein
MDWAIPDREAETNEFLLGSELVNLYQVLGGTVYLSQSLGDVFTVRAGYFDEDYSSLNKNTNWSLFNWGRKMPNARLDPASSGRIHGMRFSADLRAGGAMDRERLLVEVEHVPDSGIKDREGYTRYFGSLRYGQRFWYGTALVARLAGGLSNEQLPDQRAFRLGGLNTLRGYEPGEVPELPPGASSGFDYHGGGTRMALANIEYLAGMPEHFGIAFFGDAGGVWRDGEAVRSSGIRRDIGIGLILSGWSALEASVPDEDDGSLRINWAMPVGPVAHGSHWTVNFVQPF